MNGLARYLRSCLAERQLSAAELARRSGLGRSTIYVYLNGTRATAPDEATLQAFAKALRVPLADLRRAASLPTSATSKFELPAEAARLTPKQRKAVLAVVAAMLDSGSAKR